MRSLGSVTGRGFSAGWENNISPGAEDFTIQHMMAGWSESRCHAFEYIIMAYKWFDYNTKYNEILDELLRTG